MTIHALGIKRPHLAQAPQRMFFGNNPVNYEKDIQVQLEPQPLKTVPIQEQSGIARLFLQPTNQVSNLFTPEGPVGTHVAALLQKLINERRPEPLKDTVGNIISPFKPDSKKMDHSVLQALRQGLNTLPNQSKTVHIQLPPQIKSPGFLAREIAEEATLRGYNNRLHRQNNQFESQLSSIQVHALAPYHHVFQQLSEGQAIGKGTNLAKFLVDAPPNLKNPQWVSLQAKTMADAFPEIKTHIHERPWIEAQRMGMFLSVAAGNQQRLEDQPRLLEMIYTPPGGNYDKTIMLVGKGIIFDTGGTNLKNGSDAKSGKLYIHGMHGDMAGAAAVIGAMKTIAMMKVPHVRVVALTPLTPNRIGENATLPHSIVTARSGKRVEVSNTDAEGRLILGDAMHYGAEKYSPDLIIDIATLTGGKVGALGDKNSVAVMGNSLALTKRFTKLEESLGRKAAAVELTDAHRRWVTKDGKGKADIYNSVAMKAGSQFGVYGKGVEFEREKHIIHHSAQGGAFLKEFLPNPKTPWIHLDIAGAEFEAQEHLGNEEYATGFGVKDLYMMVDQVSKNQLKLTMPSRLSTPKTSE